MKKSFVLVVMLCASCMIWAQQTGSISGKVKATNGDGLPGVTISAQSDVLPQPRNAISQASGAYRFNALPPGKYTVTFTMPGFTTVKADVIVRLQADSDLDVTLGTETQEVMTVEASLPLISKTSTEIKSTFDEEVFSELPLGEEYRDMVKLIPGVQITEDAVRGPSAGGSGQDNIYKFDGVDVTLPMFGTLSSEPSSHDIAEVAVVKGGSQAVNFNRSGGMSINTISKSGTNSFNGEVEFKLQMDSWVADEKRDLDELSAALVGETERSWLTANIGGPLVQDRLFFFVSYYSPTTDRTNRVNAYGEMPDGKYTRDEYFLKLTWSPLDNFTVHASYRDSSSEFEKSTVYSATSASVTSGSTSDQEITIVEGDWIVSNNGTLSFKYQDYVLDTFGGPDNMLSVRPANDASAHFDFNNLDQMGYVGLANLRDPDSYGLFNEFMAPLLERYGYIDNNGEYAAGTIGAHYEINDQDFSRTAFQVGYDHYMSLGAADHNFHIGYRMTEDAEDLLRDRNGWGIVSFQTAGFDGIPAGDYSTLDEIPFIRAEYLRKEDAGNNAVVHSEYRSHNIEINDNIEWGDWNINVGVLFSKDELYGQDLAEDSSAVSGYRVERGSKYKMYEIDWEDMIQPRIGVLRSINDTDTIQVSYARYNPPATSLPRAASWARNYHLLRTRAYFNVHGDFLYSEDVSSSSGKFFVPDMTPRGIDEFMVGYSKQLPDGWTGKLNGRYRKAAHFWEDTNNSARAWYGDSANLPGNDAEPPSDTSDYIPELGDYRAEVGGSSYVIAELDGAFTKYYEMGVDLEKRESTYYVKASYTWSHYYGNFDQDNTTATNDANVFIGSSYIADAAGRQVWDFKYGNLKGDRRHLLKLFGTYNLPWNGTLGALAFYQSGQPWETWDVETYREWTSSSSSTYRFSEPAGSRTSDSHYQVDLSYTHRFKFSDRYDLKLSMDVYNVTDNQTGYNINPYASSSTYGEPRSYYAPRRFRLSASFAF